MAGDWPFTDPENLAVFTLKRVVSGEFPIRLVCHDEDDSGWQFLDGSDVATEDAALVSLREITRIDPSILELADLPVGWVAERSSPDQPWRQAPAVSEKDGEQKLVSDVEDFGWHVIMVPEDDEGPAFAYSIGLFKNFSHPEIIVFGLDLDLMHRVINLIGEEIRQGCRLAEGGSLSGILEGFDVRFVNVATRHFSEYLGWAAWFYGHKEFPVLQCLWPDMKGRFLTDPNFPEPLRRRQPLLTP